MRILFYILNFTSATAAGAVRLAQTPAASPKFPKRATTTSTPPFTVGWLAIGSLDGSTACELDINLYQECLFDNG